MYKYYKKDDYDIMEYNFDSITEFLEYIDNTPINDEVYGNRTLESEKNDYDFFETNSFEEAENLCRYGYHENFDKLLSLKIILEKHLKLSPKKINNIIIMLVMLQL